MKLILKRHPDIDKFWSEELTLGHRRLYLTWVKESTAYADRKWSDMPLSVRRKISLVMNRRRWRQTQAMIMADRKYIESQLNPDPAPRLSVLADRGVISNRPHRQIFMVSHRLPMEKGKYETEHSRTMSLVEYADTLRVGMTIDTGYGRGLLVGKSLAYGQVRVDNKFYTVELADCQIVKMEQKCPHCGDKFNDEAEYKDHKNAHMNKGGFYKDPEKNKKFLAARERARNPHKDPQNQKTVGWKIQNAQVTRDHAAEDKKREDKMLKSIKIVKGDETKTADKKLNKSEDDINNLIINTIKSAGGSMKIPDFVNVLKTSINYNEWKNKLEQNMNTIISNGILAYDNKTDTVTLIHR